jgi:hypothetical protein
VLSCPCLHGGEACQACGRREKDDGCWEDPRDDSSSSDDKALDDSSRVLEDILSQETVSRGRPKVLCYEDTLPMVVRHPETGEDVLAISIELIHHKGADTVGDSRSFLNLNLP